MEWRRWWKEKDALKRCVKNESGDQGSSINTHQQSIYINLTNLTCISSWGCTHQPRLSHLLILVFICSSFDSFVPHRRNVLCIQQGCPSANGHTLDDNTPSMPPLVPYISCPYWNGWLSVWADFSKWWCIGKALGYLSSSKEADSWAFWKTSRGCEM